MTSNNKRDNSGFELPDYDDNYNETSRKEKTINKKQKKDEKNESIVVETTTSHITSSHDIEFKESELETMKANELKGIARSLGVSGISTMTKKAIIDKIITITERNKEMQIKKKQEEENNRNINSFNKGVIKFNVTEVIDETEWLFWRIFRNKFIFRRIMSFMDIHLSPPYNAIISVEKMIISNRISLLKEKVIKNQYLTFDCYSIYKIFKLIKTNDNQNQLFYKELFKYYKDFFNIDETFINEIIKNRCLVACIVLTRDFNIKVTEINLQFAISQGARKFLDLFLQPRFGIISVNKNTEQLLLDNKDHCLPASLKSLNWFKSKLIGLFNEHTSFEHISLKYIKWCGNKINEKLSVKLLLIIFKMIPDSLNYCKEIEIFSNSLTKQQMKLRVSNEFYYRNETLAKFYQMIFDYGELKKPSFYYLYFEPNGNEYNYDFSDLSGHIHNLDASIHINDRSHYNNLKNQNTKLKLSFQFANFKIFSNWQSTITQFSSWEHIGNETFIDCSNLIFSHCQDRKQQTKFIDLVMDHIKLNIIKKTLFFYVIIGSDNLELIKHVAMEFGDETSGHPFFFISQFIKSIDVLNYLFENCISHFKFGGVPFFFKNQELFQHFEAVYIAKFSNIDGSFALDNSFIKKLSSNINNFNFEIFRTIIERGPIKSVYSIPTPIILQIIDNQPLSSEIKLDLFKTTFTNYRPEISQLISAIKQDLPVSLDLKKFSQWWYYKMESNEIQSMQNQDYLLLLFQIGKYEEMFKNNDKIGNSGMGFASFITDVFHLNFFDHLLPFLESDTHNIDPKTILYSIFNILLGAAINGRLQTFEYIFQKHLWVIKRKVIKKDGRSRSVNLANKHLIRLINNSLDNGHIYLSQFLLGYSSASKKDFHYSNQISKQYFNNKI